MKLSVWTGYSVAAHYKDSCMFLCATSSSSQGGARIQDCVEQTIALIWIRVKMVNKILKRARFTKVNYYNT